ncbi:MAG: glycosyltransferase [Pyrinomonadaceae bacterium]|nr:glycosyltransferase [Phycisphaerales bacterium]
MRAKRPARPCLEGRIRKHKPAPLMYIAIDILLYTIIVLSVGTGVYWGIVAFHVIRTLRQVPSLRQGLKVSPALKLTAANEPAVCVIVPAHNEARTIGVLLDAILTQDYPNLHIVFSLDRCTDDTLAVIQSRVKDDPRVEIVLVDQCPENWVGKVHALHRAVTTSAFVPRADMLLFLDADTQPAPQCVRAAVNLMAARELQMLSVLSTMTSDKWFEKVVQPIAGTELLRQYPMTRANSKTHKRPFANGQFILVRRAAYESIGGHESVRSEVLEDVWLARHLSRNGHDCGFIFSGDLLFCRMYDQWDRFKKGWLRIYGECASRKPRRLRSSAFRVRFLGTVLPLIAISCVVLSLTVMKEYQAITGLTAGIFGTGIWLAVIIAIYRIGRAPLWAAPSTIVGFWIVGSLMREAARDYESGKPVIWGGKEYRREQQ